jgi:hypothetical protein
MSWIDVRFGRALLLPVFVVAAGCGGAFEEDGEEGALGKADNAPAYDDRQSLNPVGDPDKVLTEKQLEAGVDGLAAVGIGAIHVRVMAIIDEEAKKAIVVTTKVYDYAGVETWHRIDQPQRAICAVHLKESPLADDERPVPLKVLLVPVKDGKRYLDHTYPVRTSDDSQYFDQIEHVGKGLRVTYRPDLSKPDQVTETIPLEDYETRNGYQMFLVPQPFVHLSEEQLYTHIKANDGLAEYWVRIGYGCTISV